MIWQAFRGKLVADSDVAPSSASASKSPKWAFAGSPVEVGTILVSQNSYILRQQHLHKSVLLVVEHSALGSKALILNRVLRRIGQPHPLFFGGHDSTETDEFLMFSEADYEESLDGDASTVLPGLRLFKSLQPPRDAGQVFPMSGCVLWEPRHLEAEREFGAWATLSIDAATIAKEMQYCMDGFKLDSLFWPSRTSMGEDLGEEMWHHAQKVQSKVPEVHGASLADAMLSQWLLQQRSRFRMGLFRNGSLSDIEAGSLLVSNPAAFVLQKQYMHKAVVLVLECCRQRNFVVGVILNVPCEQLDLPALSCQFGGPLGIGHGRRQALLGVHSRKDWAATGKYQAIGPSQGFYKIRPSPPLLDMKDNKDFLAQEGALFLRGYVAWKVEELEADLESGCLFAAGPESSTAAAVQHCLQDEDLGRAANFDESIWELALLAMGPKFREVARPAIETQRHAAHLAGELALKHWQLEGLSSLNKLR